MRVWLVPLVVVASAAAAHALVLCTTPDGKTYAGDTPPPGCEVKSQYQSAPAEPAEAEPPASDAEAERKAAASNAAEAHALGERRRLEREINRAADDLAAVRAQMASGPATAKAAFQTAITGITQPGQAVEASPDLRARERALLAEIDGYKKQYAELTQHLAEGRGSLPASWPRALRCDRCP